MGALRLNFGFAVTDLENKAAELEGLAGFQNDSYPIRTRSDVHHHHAAPFWLVCAPSPGSTDPEVATPGWGTL